MQETLSLPDLEPAVLLDSEPRSFKIAAWVILAASLLLFTFQLESLHTVPIPDSVRWGGDETWLMREFGNQASHGVMSYPESFDGTVRTDGVLAGSMWVEALLYGVSGKVFTPAHSLVDVGRTVTACLSVLLLALVYLVCRKLKVSRLLSSLAVLLVVSSQAYVIATHSARYDILTGFALLSFSWTLTQLSLERRSGWKLWMAGVIAVACIIFSRHLSTLTVGIIFLWLYRQKIWDDLKRLLTFVTGAVLSAGLLIAAYTAGAHEFSLFGSGGGFGSYDFVLRQLPILRPFSRSVQLSNLLERYQLFSREAPGALLLILSAITLILCYLLWKLTLRFLARHVKVSATAAQSFFVAASGLATLSWLLLQGARPYYAMHILPIVIVSTMVVFEWLHETFESAPLLRYPVPALALLLALVQLPGSLLPPAVGSAIVRDQRVTMQHLLSETRPGARVLCDVAGLNWALQDTQHHALTLDMFQPPANAAALEAKLSRNQIDYVILRSSPVGSSFEPGRAFLPQYLALRGNVIDSVLGFFYDDGRSYDGEMDRMIQQGLDTLRLYKVSSARP